MLSQLTMSIVIGLVFTFIMLNMIVGCQDWDNPACVTPIEFIEIMGSPFK